MSTNRKASATGGASTVSLLGVALVVLKLCHLIDWPWIWVLAPFWLAPAVCVAVLGFFMILYFLKR